MRIQFSVNKKAWISKGINPPDCGSVKIEVDLSKLSQEERGFIAKHFYEGGNGGYTIKPMGEGFAPLQSEGDTEQDAINAIQQGMAEQKAYKEKEDQTNREKIMVLRGKIQDWLGNPFVGKRSETVHGTYEKKTVPRREVPALQRMIDGSHSITYRTLLRHVPVEELKDMFQDYEWRPGVPNELLRLKNDFAASFCRSTWKGKRCYYITWSAIEFVFLK